MKKMVKRKVRAVFWRVNLNLCVVYLARFVKYDHSGCCWCDLHFTKNSSKVTIGLKVFLLFFSFWITSAEFWIRISGWRIIYVSKSGLNWKNVVFPVWNSCELLFVGFCLLVLLTNIFDTTNPFKSWFEKLG